MMKTDNSKKALRASLGYTVGNVLIRGISFISLPIFAYLFTVSDYGVYNTFTAYSSMLFVVIGFALHSCLKNANIDYQNDINSFCSSLLILVFGNSILLLVVSLWFSKGLSSILALEKPVLLPLIVINSLFLFLSTYYNSIISIKYEYKEYLAISLFYAISSVGISVVLILTVYDSSRYMGRIVGTLISGGILSVYIVKKIFEKARPKVNIQYWKYALKISIPIIPHGLSQLVLSQFDRLMINKTIGSIEAGLYSFAYNVGSIFQIIANSVDTAWAQWFFDQMEENNKKKIRKVANFYLLVMSIGACLLVSIAPEIISLLGGKKYFDARRVSIPIVLAMYFSYLYFFPASIEYYYKKTQLIAIGTCGAAVLNVVLNMIFIPLYGFEAAAYTTVVCYFLYFIIHTIFTRVLLKERVFDLKIQVLLLALTLLISCISIIFVDYIAVRILVFIGLLFISLFVALRRKDVVLPLVKSVLRKQ